MHETPFLYGYERRSSAKGEKTYRAVIATSPLEQRKLKRRFRTAREALDYGRRWIFRYRKMAAQDL